MSFNPCFTGFTFQSAVKRAVGVPTCVFQSLFYWIYLSKIEKLFYCLVFDHVSILVLLDLPFKVSQHPIKEPLAQVSILVLLDLPFKADTRRLIHALQLSFNPCFTGFTFQSSSPATFNIKSCGFQSLFYWIYLSKNQREI